MPKANTILETTAIKVIVDDANLASDLRKTLTAIERLTKQSPVSIPVKTDASSVEALTTAINRSAPAIDKMTAATKRQGQAIDPVKAKYTSLINESASLRNTMEAGMVTKDAAIKRFLELQSAASKASVAFADDSIEYRKFTQVAAQASRSVATLEGRTTKLGLSGNVAVGVTSALQGTMSNLGPAGNIASRGVGIASVALGGFAKSAGGTETVVQRLVGGFARLGAVMPLIAAGASVAATVSLIKLGNAAADTADTIDKASQSAGLSAQAYQEMTYALSQSGVELDKAKTGLADFNKRIGQAVAGNKQLTDTYARLGVSLKDANGKVRDTEAIFNDVLRAMDGVNTAAEKAGIASRLFGDDFSRVLLPALNAGSDGFDLLRKKAAEMGLILSNDGVKSLVAYKDAMATVTQQFSTAKVEIVGAFIPLITNQLIPLIQNTVVPWLQHAADGIKGFADEMTDAGPAGDAFRQNVAKTIAPMLELGLVATAMGETVLGIFNVLSGAAKGFTADTQAVIDAVKRGDMKYIFGAEGQADRRSTLSAEGGPMVTQGLGQLGDALKLLAADPTKMVTDTLDAYLTAALTATAPTALAPRATTTPGVTTPTGTAGEIVARTADQVMAAVQKSVAARIAAEQSMGGARPTGANARNAIANRDAVFAKLAWDALVAQAKANAEYIKAHPRPLTPAQFNEFPGTAQGGASVPASNAQAFDLQRSNRAVILQEALAQRGRAQALQNQAIANARAAARAAMTQGNASGFNQYMARTLNPLGAAATQQQFGTKLGQAGDQASKFGSSLEVLARAGRALATEFSKDAADAAANRAALRAAMTQGNANAFENDRQYQERLGRRYMQQQFGMRLGQGGDQASQYGVNIDILRQRGAAVAQQQKRDRDEVAKNLVDSSLELAQNVVGAGRGFASAIGQFQAGNVGGGVSGLLGTAGSIASLVPGGQLAGGIISIVAPLIGDLLNLGGGAGTRPAPLGGVFGTTRKDLTNPDIALAIGSSQASLGPAISSKILDAGTIMDGAAKRMVEAADKFLAAAKANRGIGLAGRDFSLSDALR